MPVEYNIENSIHLVLDSFWMVANVEIQGKYNRMNSINEKADNGVYSGVPSSFLSDRNFSANGITPSSFISDTSALSSVGSSP